jgi:hypothetical protein
MSVSLRKLVEHIGAVRDKTTIAGHRPIGAGASLLAARTLIVSTTVQGDKK